MTWIMKETTLTGQQLIKFSKKITNHFYNNELGTQRGLCYLY